jgi:hypothetical protein
MVARWRFPFALGLGLALACSPDAPTTAPSGPGGTVASDLAGTGSSLVTAYVTGFPGLQ